MLKLKNNGEQSMSIMNSFRTAFVIFLIAMLLGGSLRIWTQHSELKRLKQHNNLLKNQTEQLNSRLLLLKAQAANLSEVLTRHQNTKKKMEVRNDSVRQQLQVALGQDVCADRLVPDDVIRLQRNGAGSAPLPTNAYSRLFTGTLRAP
jgi:septal ring factor EnvC (AmiA/AmiB activator)